MRTLLLAIKMH